MQNGALLERTNLLAFPATREDVAAVIRGLPVRKAAGPDGLTYELFKTLVNVPALLEVMTESISMRVEGRRRG